MEEILCRPPPPRPPVSALSQPRPPAPRDLRVFFTQRPHFCESGMCAKSASFPLLTFVLLRLLLQLFCKEEKRGADVSVRAPLPVSTTHASPASAGWPLSSAPLWPPPPLCSWAKPTPGGQPPACLVPRDLRCLRKKYSASVGRRAKTSSGPTRVPRKALFQGEVPGKNTSGKHPTWSCLDLVFAKHEKTSLDTACRKTFPVPG